MIGGHSFHRVSVRSFRLLRQTESRPRLLAAMLVAYCMLPNCSSNLLSPNQCFQSNCLATFQLRLRHALTGASGAAVLRLLFSMNWPFGVQRTAPILTLMLWMLFVRRWPLSA